MTQTKKYMASSLVALGFVALLGTGTAYASFNADRAEHAQTHIAQAVEDGRLTQAEADERLAKMQSRHANREVMRNAVEGNDYNAWLAAATGKPMAEKVTAQNFSRLVEAHNAHEAGDHDAVKAIMQELGMERGHGKRGMSHEGMGDKMGGSGHHRMHK